MAKAKRYLGRRSCTQGTGLRPAAAAAPLRIMALCVEAVELIEGFEALGNRMAVSDAGCAAACLWAAISAANLNVRINTRLMKDRVYAARMNAEVDELMRKYWKQADETYEFVFEKLKN